MVCWKSISYKIIRKTFDIIGCLFCLKWENFGVRDVLQGFLANGLGRCPKKARRMERKVPENAPKCRKKLRFLSKIGRWFFSFTEK